MSMKNFVITNIEWNKHHSRHRSSADRVASKHRQPLMAQSPLRVESIPESSQVKSPACDGSMPLSRHSLVELGSTDDDVSAVPSSSSKFKEPVIEYRRQPRNPVLKNGVSRCDQLAGVEKTEVRKNGLVLGDEGSRTLNKSSPGRKKNIQSNDKNNSAMEITEELEKTGTMALEEDGELAAAMVVEEEVKDFGDMEEEEEGKDIEAMTDAKTWNFRPRNPIRQSLNLNGSNFSKGRLTANPKCPSPKKQEVVKKDSVKKENRKKRCLAATLTKEEIKEDLNQWAQLGLMPPKKHIKRPKSVQKKVDKISPGASLDSLPITPDLYKVKKNVRLM